MIDFNINKILKKNKSNSFLSAKKIAKNSFKLNGMGGAKLPTFSFSTKNVGKGLNAFNLKNFGVKKKKRLISDLVSKNAFGIKAGVPIADYPESYGYKRTRKEISPREFMDLAKQGYGGGYDKWTHEEHKENVISQLNVDRLKPIIKDPKGEMNIPWLETKRGIVRDHEGRHRAVGAEQLGMEKIPVYFVETDKGYIGEQALASDLVSKNRFGESERFYDELRDQEYKDDKHLLVPALAEAHLMTPQYEKYVKKQKDIKLFDDIISKNFITQSIPQQNLPIPEVLPSLDSKGTQITGVNALDVSKAENIIGMDFDEGFNKIGIGYTKNKEV